MENQGININSPSRKALSVLTFDRLETFLNAYLEQCQIKNSRFTAGALAARMGFKSTAGLFHYLKGSRVPTPQHQELMIRFFEFDDEEKKHFSALIELQMIEDKGPISFKLLREKMQRDLPRVSKIIDNKSLAVASHWLHYTVKELLSTGRRFKNTADIFNAIRVGLKEKFRITEVLDDLNCLGLIEYDEEGNLRSGRDISVTREKGVNVDIQRFHRGVLDLGKAALEDIHPDDRYFSSITFQGDRQKFERLCAFIKELEKECLLNKEMANVREVYHCNIQLFPVTKSEENVQQEIRQ